MYCLFCVKDCVFWLSGIDFFEDAYAHRYSKVYPGLPFVLVLFAALGLHPSVAFTADYSRKCQCSAWGLLSRLSATQSVYSCRDIVRGFWFGWAGDMFS